MHAPVRIWRWFVSNDRTRDPGRSGVALGVALAFCVFGIPAVMAALMVGGYPPALRPEALVGQVVAIWAMGVVIAFVSAVPLFCVAALGWGLLDHLGVRSPIAAVAYGAAIAQAPPLLMVHSANPYWGVSGVIVGGFIWAVAYAKRGVAK
jgi:hypothetical protein